MTLFTESKIRVRARRSVGLYESADKILGEVMKKQASVAGHDIFLSHAYDDKELVLGMALTIEDLGYSVFLDWRDDPSLDRKHVTPITADKLRYRMKASKCIFFSTTENASESKWMPWELGFKDGHNSRAAILPISLQNVSSYSGQQYLGIYPYITQGQDINNKERLWVRRSSSCYIDFDTWLKGNDPYEH
jgi:hypothetical protein